MFNARGGGGSKGAAAADAAAKTILSPGGSPDGGGAEAGEATKVLDLIQPHSVSGEEVAGFYGCTMGQVTGMMESGLYWCWRMGFVFVPRCW